MLKKHVSEGFSFENWPDPYYEEEDPARRKAMLEAWLKDHPDSEQDKERLQLHCLRFLPGKKEMTDRFIRAWLMIRIAENDRISFLNRKGKEKELRENLKELCILDYPLTDTLKREWRDFARKYLIICCQSRSYRTAGFGLVSVSDEKAALKLAREIDLITRIIPEKFSLQNECVPFRETVIRMYCDLLENGEEYWNRYNGS